MDLTLTLVQSDLQWQEVEANRRLLEQQLAARGNKPTDLIILPEMFTSSFSMDAAAVAEDYPGETLTWMQTMAARFDAALTGSVAVKADGSRYNRLLFVLPSGEVFIYDKRHLFRMMNEHQRYSPGSGKTLVKWREWRILPLVCYDLRFPLWCRNTAAEPYDLLLFVANWPAARAHHWRILLQARAVENLSYVAGVNRVGVDGKGIEYAGDSAVYHPDGSALLEAADKAGCHDVTLSQASLAEYRSRFPAHLDADAFTLRDS